MKILMRATLAEEHEVRAAQEAGFTIVGSRSECRNEDVICRYSALPFYDELEKDLLLNGCRMINTYRQHRYVADIANWYGDLEPLTPKTWFKPSDAIADRAQGPFVLKGETNSRKHLWSTHMFAKDLDALRAVHNRLLDDSLIGAQDIYVRQFEEFETAGTGINDMPITNEWRYFVLDGQIVGSGFYWSEHYDMVPESWLLPDEFRDNFVQLVDAAIGDNVRFYVVDVARSKDGYRVVELNDGQMSGLSNVDAYTLYHNMRKVLDGERV